MAYSRSSKKLLRLIFILVVIIGFLIYWFTVPKRIDATELPEFEPNLINGETMFWVGGCGSCHAQEFAGGDEKFNLGGGLKLNTEFGTFVVPNISPDPDFGIGSWTDADFVNAMKYGVSPNGRHLYPSFPYTSYQYMTMQDMLDLKAFIDTLPPIESEVSQHNLKFPFYFRRGIGLWKFLYFKEESFEIDSNATYELNRGKYLVEGPGHCAECHTIRDIFGGLNKNHWLAGAPAADGDGFVPNITPSEDGIGYWSLEDISYSLESGFTPEFDSFGGTMASVQDNLSRLTAEDRNAIATYLKSITPLPTPVELPIN